VSEPGGEVIVYRSPDGQAVVQLRAVGGTVWLTQAQLAELYDTSVPNIAQIIRRVLDDGEVAEATINSELRVQAEGARQVQREVKIYNLDMVLAVGYRVTTPRAVQFRKWATTVLREYLVKGFVLDDPRLKDPAGTDYYDELLQRIRNIRASELRFYQKVRDLFAASSADYDGTSATVKTFFATIQNKLIFAVTGRTAADLVLQRSDPRSPSMGLTTWKGDRVHKSEVVVAKNYLTEPEIRAQPAHHYVPRLRRRPRPATAGHPDGRVGNADRSVSRSQREDAAVGPGQRLRVPDEAGGRGTLHRVRPAPPGLGGRACCGRGAG